MAVREGLWDCQYCGTKGILGRHKACPVCAQSRPHGTRFYLPEDAAVVEDAERLGYAQAGPDWVCEFCGASNPATAVQCTSCLAERGTAPEQTVTTYQPGQAPKQGDMSFDEPPAATLQPKPKPQSIPKLWLVMGGIAAVVLLCVCGIFAAGWGTEQKSVRIQQFEWERTADIEAYQTVQKEDWELPARGRLISQEEQIRTYTRVQSGVRQATCERSERVRVGTEEYVCGERDLGNGFFEDVICMEPIYETRYETYACEEPIYQDVPVMGTYYTYEIDEWLVVRTAVAEGNDQNARDPDYKLAENERLGETTASYAVVFVDDERETYRLSFGNNYNEWRALESNGRYEIEVTRLGAVTLLD